MRVIVNRDLEGALRHRPRRHAEQLRRQPASGRRIPSCSSTWRSRFVDNGLSIKELHREIMLSAVYQLERRSRSPRTSTRTPATGCTGASSRRRMTAEQVRDSLLFVAGALDTKMGGPSAPLTPLVRSAHGLRQGQPLQARRVPAAVRLPEPEPLRREALHHQRAAAAAVLHEQRLHAAAGRAAGAHASPTSPTTRARIAEGVSPRSSAARRPTRS